MNPSDLRIIYEYNYWARDRILDAVRQLSEQQWLGPAPFGPTSLRGVLVHAMDSEYAWRTFLETNEWMPDTPEELFPTIDALAASTKRIDAKILVTYP